MRTSVFAEKSIAVETSRTFLIHTCTHISSLQFNQLVDFFAQTPLKPRHQPTMKWSASATRNNSFTTKSSVIVGSDDETAVDEWIDDWMIMMLTGCLSFAQNYIAYDEILFYMTSDFCTFGFDSGAVLSLKVYVTFENDITDFNVWTLITLYCFSFWLFAAVIPERIKPWKLFTV